MVYFCYCAGDHRDLRSFPTRRSSDLLQIRTGFSGPSSRTSASGLRMIVPPGPAPAYSSAVELPITRSRGIPYSSWLRSEEHTSELQSQSNLVCRLLLEKKKQRPHPCR